MPKGIKKTGFSIENHKEVAELLKGMRNELSGIWVKLSNAYPQNNKRAAKAIRQIDKAQKAIDQARNELDNLIHLEHELPDGQIWKGVYYGSDDND